MDGEAYISEPMTERHGRLLAAFAQRAAQLAQDLADRALAAETADEAERLAKAFHVVGRSLRQAVALEQRLEREAARAIREHHDETHRARAKAVEARQRQVRSALRPLVWSESEVLDFLGHEDEERARELWRGETLDAVEELIETAAQDAEAFLAEPLPAQVRRLAGELGLGEADDVEDDSSFTARTAHRADPAAWPEPRADSS